MTNMQLEDTFNNLYTSLPVKVAEIDDTEDCCQQGCVETKQKLSTRFHDEINPQPQPKVGGSASEKRVTDGNNEDLEAQSVRSEKTVTTIATKTVQRGNEVAEKTQKVEKKEIVVKSTSNTITAANNKTPLSIAGTSQPGGPLLADD